MLWEHVGCYLILSSLFGAEYYSIVRTDRIWFIYSSADRRLDRFHFGAVTSGAAMNICVQFFSLFAYVFGSFGSLPRSGIARPYGNSIA